MIVSPTMKLKVAVEGCCHGALDKIYDQIALLERKNAYKVDLLLICGDFQAIRNRGDLLCMSVPQKYRHLGGFYKYYIGERTAPILTIVIGGNHEASNYMWELYHGGWLAPNIYFLGFSGCVQVNGVRIAGSSGIYKLGDYYLGHHETLPYNHSTLRSIYHVRHYDVFKLAQLSSPTIFLSHDWPNTIERYGDTEELLRHKPFFRQEVQRGLLGSPPMLDLLKKLKPQWWFSAHLHVKFEALYPHGNIEKPTSRPPVNPDEIVIEDVEDSPVAVHNPDEIQIDEDDDDDDLGTASNSQSNLGVTKSDVYGAHSLSSSGVQACENTATRFLALDKCLPNRECIEVVDIPVPESFPAGSVLPRFTFDPEWLSITRALHPFLCTTKHQVSLPKADDARTLILKELEWVRTNVQNAGQPEISQVQKFRPTGPGPTESENRQPSWYTNPQTEGLMRLLQIPNKINPMPVGTSMVQSSGSPDGKGNSDKQASRWDLEVPIPDLEHDDTQFQEVTHKISEPSREADTELISSGGWSPSRIVE